MLKARASKSKRSAEARSFILSAEEVLKQEYGCDVEIVGDISLLENLTISTEYMNQAISVLATVTRSGRGAKIKFVSDEKALQITATVPTTFYRSSLRNSYVAQSSADLSDFSYSTEEIGENTCVIIKVILEKHAAIALYAISPSEVRDIIKSAL